MPHSYSATEHYRSHEPLIRDALRGLLRSELEVRYGKGPLIFHTVEMVMYVLERGATQATLSELADHFSTSVSTVRRVIRRLQETCWLNVERVCLHNGAQSANRYSINGSNFMRLLRSTVGTHPAVYSLVVRHLYEQPYAMSTQADSSDEEQPADDSEDPWKVVEQKLVEEGFSRADEIVALLKKWAFDPETIAKGININNALAFALMMTA